MSLIEKAKQTVNYLRVQNKFWNEYSHVIKQDTLTVENLDMGKREDRHIALEVILRGKTEEEYWGIVDSLFVAFDQAKTDEEKDQILELQGMIMGIGETNRGIDWA